MKPSIEVIVLGSSGGPVDKNNSCYLVKSTSIKLSEKDSLLAIDAGSLLSGILNILENEFNENTIDDERIFPLSELPHTTLNANAHHILTQLLSGICLTHQHMDHIVGLILNSVCFTPESPKLVAALPDCLDGLVQHVFNGSIWPNLTNESIDRYGHRTLLKTGYSIYLERLNAIKEYSEITKGLSISVFPISHGNHQICGKAKPILESTRTTATTAATTTTIPPIPPPQNHLQNSPPPAPPPTIITSPSSSHSSFISTSPSSVVSACSCSTDTTTYTDASTTTTVPRPISYDSSAYFIQDKLTSSVVLIFGDVEADSISSNPRNQAVWNHAVPFLEKQLLKGIFIECSYINSRPNELLYGHLKPFYLIEELLYLSSCSTKDPTLSTLRIVITHIKIELSTYESPHQQILKELTTLAEENNLKCTFELSIPGTHLYF